MYGEKITVDLKKNEIKVHNCTDWRHWELFSIHIAIITVSRVLSCSVAIVDGSESTFFLGVGLLVRRKISSLSVESFSPFGTYLPYGSSVNGSLSWFLFYSGY